MTSRANSSAMGLALIGAAIGIGVGSIATLSSQQVHAQDSTSLSAWWQTSFGRPIPSTVQPLNYSRELSAQGIGCRTSARQPEWATAEAVGHQVMQTYEERKTLPGQSIGTWQEDLDSAFNNGPLRFLSCQIANRGANDKTPFLITHGSRSFPQETLRILKGLQPVTSTSPTNTSTSTEVAELKRKLAAIAELAK